MANCLHKLVGRAAVINPIFNQNRQLRISVSTYCPNQINAQCYFQCMPLQTIGPIVKPKLLAVRTPTFVQPVAFLSKSSADFNETSSNDGDGGANEEKLSIVYETLRKELPQFFVTQMNYRLVHKDIVFENRIRGKTYHGIVDYVKQMTYLRFYGHFMYAYVKLDVLKMTKHTEDSSIKVRWRVSGISGYRILFKMIQFRVWRPKQMIEQHQSVWIDGFSTFYVNRDGLIVRHIADKVMPDEDKEANPIEKVVNNLGQVPKLALFVKLSTDIAPLVV